LPKFLASSLSALSHRRLALVITLTFFLLILPDLVFHLAGFQTTAVRKPESVFLAAVFALTLSLIEQRRLRLSAIAFVIFSQLLWLGCIAYFGKALSPEQILLSTTEAADITSGILDGMRTLLPAIAMIAVTGSLLFWLHWPPLDRSALGPLSTVWIFVAVLIGCAGYWLAHKRAAILVPGAQTWSGLGPYHALVGAARASISKVSPPAGVEIRDQIVTRIPLADEPVTVAVIMGEGITPSRLSHFDYTEKTSPRLDAWKISPPAGFELISKVGFAGGVATLGSVPSFLKLAYWPVEAELRGQNLFDLAKAQGFKTYFLSAQSRHFLDVAGGARNAELVFVEQGNRSILDKKHDDALLDLVREIPHEAARRFVFVHQRVNHSNYTSHCTHLPKEEQKPLYTTKPADASNQARRRAAYENGLKCWDRNTTLLAEAFARFPGAVYVFITADHSEMMGEEGLWGHSMANLKVALAPVFLFTNRPLSDVAERFRSLNPPTVYSVSQLVARAFGLEVETPGTRADRFYLNNTMPFGRSGYFEVDVLAPDRFLSKRYTKEGKLLENKTVELPLLRQTNEVARAR